MKLHYYPETDSLYIELIEKPGVATFEIREGLNVDVDADDNVVGFDIDHLATFIANGELGKERDENSSSCFAADTDYTDNHDISYYANAFDVAVVGRGIHHYMGDFSGIANPCVQAQVPCSVSMAFDDSVPLIGAEQDVLASV